MDRLISEERVLRVVKHIIRWMDCECDKSEVIKLVEDRIKTIPSAEPKKCKNCKWWRDSDGAYRRGVKAESKCPINTVSVANGWGYCYMFEPQERSEDAT